MEDDATPYDGKITKPQGPAKFGATTQKKTWINGNDKNKQAKSSSPAHEAAFMKPQSIRHADKSRDREQSSGGQPRVQSAKRAAGHSPAQQPIYGSKPSKAPITISLDPMHPDTQVKQINLFENA